MQGGTSGKADRRVTLCLYGTELFITAYKKVRHLSLPRVLAFLRVAITRNVIICLVRI
jgi:hypothetical protein